MKNLDTKLFNVKSDRVPEVLILSPACRTGRHKDKKKSFAVADFLRLCFGDSSCLRAFLRFSFTWGFIACAPLASFAQGDFAATTLPDTIPAIKTDSSVFQLFVPDQYNYIEFYNRNDLGTFLNKWQSDTAKKITIAHFGDSHVQPGIFTGQVRNLLQTQRGSAGVGIVFPYSAAKTYAPLSYKSIHYGKWAYAKGLEPRPRLPLGVSGMTIKTIDPAAGFMITFREPQPEHYRKLKLFFKGGNNSYDFRVLTRNHEVVVPASQQHPDEPYYELTFPDSSNFVHIQVLKTDESQSSFEFYGMSLESIHDTGLVLHSLGVGGAPYGSVLKSVLIDTQLPVLDPDLVVLDFGTNDFLYTQQIPLEMEREIVKTISWVRQLTPHASILLTSTQDMYRHGQDVMAAAEFSQLIRRIAREQHCGLYDWYRISGGPASMQKWVKARHARTDYIHLNKNGYLLKGELFANAFQKTFIRYSTETALSALTIDRFPGDTIQVDSILVAAVGAPKVKSDWVTTRHIIRSGETLSGIADTYRVRVSDIMQRNNMNSTTIVAGKAIYVQHRPVQSVTARIPNPKTKATPMRNDPNVIHYKVVSGDTLGQIAERYRVSVRELKRLNGLRNSTIVEGKVLLIQVK